MLAQTVASSIAMPGRWSLPNGGGGGGGRLSLASHATSGGGSSPRSARSSFTRRAGVQVWVPVHGRTEMHEISLRGLPAGSTSGLFKVQRGGASNDDLNNNDDDDKHASGDTKGGGELPSNGSKKKPLATTFPGARSASARLAPSASRQTTRSPSPGRHHEGEWTGGTVIAASGGGGAARGTDG
ncbi:unnamed protein product, partial [Ectocarpus sp. 13 AM-2016]